MKAKPHRGLSKGMWEWCKVTGLRLSPLTGMQDTGKSEAKASENHIKRKTSTQRVK